MVYAGGAINAGIKLAELGKQQAEVGVKLTRQQERGGLPLSGAEESQAGCHHAEREGSQRPEEEILRSRGRPLRLCWVVLGCSIQVSIAMVKKSRI